MTERATHTELAAAIAALINAKPRSPTLAEIEALIQTHRDAEAAPLFHAVAGLDVPNDPGNADDGMIWRFANETQTLFAGVFDAHHFQVDSIDPTNLVTVLGKAPNGRDAYWAGPPRIEYEWLDVTILHADPFVLMSLPNSQAVRAINGCYIQPNRLFVRWYDDETDCVRLELVPSWGLARALAPEKYAALMQALHATKVTP